VLKQEGAKLTGIKTSPWCILIQEDNKKYEHKENGLQFMILNVNTYLTFELSKLQKYAVTATDILQSAEHYQHLKNNTTVTLRLTMGIRSKKRIVRQFRHCESVVVCTYTNLDSRAYYTPRLYGTDCCFYATNLNNMLLYLIL
jgi:hypothetical protein